MVERLELLAIRDLNPLALPDESTLIDLCDWERFDKDPEEIWPGLPS